MITDDRKVQLLSILLVAGIGKQGLPYAEVRCASDQSLYVSIMLEAVDSHPMALNLAANRDTAHRWTGELFDVPTAFCLLLHCHML